MLALRAILSAAFVSAFTGASSFAAVFGVSSAFGVSAPTFAATAADTLSFVFSTFVDCATAFGVSSLVAALVVFSAVVLLETSSDA